MDKLLHFTISLILTYFIFFLIFPPKPLTVASLIDRKTKNPSIQKKLILGVLIGLSLIFVIGIWKEWFDQWGFGNVEVGDVIADMLGIAAGYGLSRIRMKSSMPTVHIDVNLRSTATQKQSEEILPDNEPVHFKSSVHRNKRDS